VVIVPVSLPGQGAVQIFEGGFFVRTSFSWLTAVVVLMFLAVGGTAAQAQVTGPGASASAKKPKPQPAVKILDAGQKALTGPGIKLRVTANTRMKVRVTVSSTTFDNGASNLTKPRVISFGKKGRKVVRIPLNKGGKAAAASCAARQVSVIAQTGKRRARASRDMARQLKDCRLGPVELSRAADCDWIAQPNEGLCMMPFPSDYYTVKDSSTETGKRINFTSDGMPRNNQNIPINPASYLASDGFSQGQSIVLKVPGIDTPADIERNGFVQLNALGRYAESDQKAVVIDGKTGKRWPIWVDVDQTGTDPAKAALMISPAKNFDEKGRYIVALRRLLGPDGKVIPAPNAFRYLRDAIPSGQQPVNQRRDRYEGIFRTLRKAGIKRSDLYLAWDFTVASNENNYERALHMRNDAFAELGDTTMADQVVQGDSPDFVVSPPGVLANARPEIEREIRGTYTVPCYLTNGCEPGGVITLNAEGLPERQGNYEAKFTCIVPPVGLIGPNPPKLRPYIFGHGLVGTGRQVTGSINPNLVQEHAMIACATDEIGMANEDIPTIFQSLTELSSFDVVPDRLQQGLLNELFLARLMYHPDGLGTHPAFQQGGESVIRNDHVYYMGASQGGIMGGPLTAISPDFTQSALVVGAMNYSTMLTRSSNWKTYAIAFNVSYPNELARPLVLSLIQMLWDRGEPNGYAHVMTDNPPPETPEHRIAMHVALGDHQVSNFASDVQARTVPGVKTPAGGISPQRWPDYEELWNIPRIKADEYPYYGSSIVYWDGGPFRKNPNFPPGRENIGTGVSPYGNVPPSMTWEDPHGAPRGASGPVEMINTFFDPNGYIEDICNGAPCLGDGWDGDYDSVIVP
jgi:hypothetical protein